MTNQEYYEDPKEWGGGQFVYLEQIINDYMASRGSDDHDSMALRAQVVIVAKSGVRELYYDVAMEVKGIEMELNPRLSLTVPPDFVDWVRVSWMDGAGNMRRMAENKGTPLAQIYLQDHEFEILFDNEGEVLKGGSMFDHSNKTFSNKVGLIGCGFNPNVNTSSSHPNGSFQFDSTSGVIQFSSDVDSRSIILEYISDGVDIKDTAKIRVHKFAEAAVRDYIYYELIKKRKNVPSYEKQGARKEYYNSRRIAKRRLSAFKLEDLRQALKGGTRWVK